MPRRRPDRCEFSDDKLGLLKDQGFHVAQISGICEISAGAWLLLKPYSDRYQETSTGSVTRAMQATGTPKSNPQNPHSAVPAMRLKMTSTGCRCTAFFK